MVRSPPNESFHCGGKNESRQTFPPLSRCRWGLQLNHRGGNAAAALIINIFIEVSLPKDAGLL